MQSVVFQELQELITGLNAFAPALEQAVNMIKSLRAELNSLKGEELAEDEKQARDEAALLGSLRAFTATIATMGEKVAEAIVEESAPEGVVVEAVPTITQTTATTIPPIPPITAPTA